MKERLMVAGLCCTFVGLALGFSGRPLLAIVVLLCGMALKVAYFALP